MSVDLILTGKIVIFVDPVSYSGKPRCLSDLNCGRTVEKLLGVEYVVYLLVLEKSVGVDARAGNVKVFAHKGGHRRNVVSHLALEVVCNVGDSRGVHTVKASS
jgi:hypothetical protein